MSTENTKFEQADDVETAVEMLQDPNQQDQLLHDIKQTAGEAKDAYHGAQDQVQAKNPCEAAFDRIRKAALEQPTPFQSLTDPLDKGALSFIDGLDHGGISDAADRMSQIGQATLEAGVWLPGLIFEIFRDFFQLISLFFSFVFDVPFELQLFIVPFTFILNLDFSFFRFPVFNIDFGFDPAVPYLAGWWIMFFGSLILMGLLLFLVKKIQPNPDKEYIMLRSWSKISPTSVTLVRVVTFCLTLVYLPVSQNALELLVCSYKYKSLVGSCPSAIYYISAAAAVGIMTIACPIGLAWLIFKNAPKEREFDASGVPGEYTLEDWRVDLAKIENKNPLATLFNPYRSHMRYFKVIVMGLKLYILLVGVGLSSNSMTGFGEKVTKYTNTSVVIPLNETHAPNEIQLIPETTEPAWNHLRPILMIFGLGVYTGVTIVSKPFISNLANVLDVILRIVAMICLFLAYLIAFDVAVSALAITMTVVLCIAIIIAIAFIALGCDAVQEKVRILRGDVEFTTNEGVVEDPIWFKPKTLHYTTLIKRRVWHCFWDSFLSYYGRNKPAENNYDFEYVDTEDTTAYLLSFENKCTAQRHHENKEIIMDIGKEAYLQALKDTGVNNNNNNGNRNPFEMEAYAIRMLHGRDCYWEGRFGCLYIIPFPFEAYFVPDGANPDDPAEKIHRSELSKLISDNSEPKVREVRSVREKIRALAADHKTVNFDFTRTETISVAKRNLEGNEYYEDHQVEVTYSTIEISVTQDADSPVYHPPGTNVEELEEGLPIVPGFNVTATLGEGRYNDEHRDGFKPAGQSFDFMAHFLLRSYMALEGEMPEGLSKLFEDNLDALQRDLSVVLAKKDAFRRHYMREFYHKQRTLSYSFWPEVYDDPYIPRHRLDAWLAKWERNSLLRKLGGGVASEKRSSSDQASAGIRLSSFVDMIELRMRYAALSPAIMVWCGFWHDVWFRNLDMDIITESDDAKRILNPWVPDSLSWNICCKQHCNGYLRAAGLQSETGGGWIKQGLIDKLYDAMGKAAKMKPSDCTYSIDMTQPDPGLMKDRNRPGQPVLSKDAHVVDFRKRYREAAAEPPYRSCQYGLWPRNRNHPALKWLLDFDDTVTNDFYDEEVALLKDEPDEESDVDSFEKPQTMMNAWATDLVAGKTPNPLIKPATPPPPPPGQQQQQQQQSPPSSPLVIPFSKTVEALFEDGATIRLRSRKTSTLLPYEFIVKKSPLNGVDGIVGYHVQLVLRKDDDQKLMCKLYRQEPGSGSELAEYWTASVEEENHVDHQKYSSFTSTFRPHIIGPDDNCVTLPLYVPPTQSTPVPDYHKWLVCSDDQEAEGDNTTGLLLGVCDSITVRNAAGIWMVEKVERKDEETTLEDDENV